MVTAGKRTIDLHRNCFTACLRLEKGRLGTGKAIVALARKFLGIIYRTLKNQWVFEDFPNLVLVEKATA